MTDKLWIIVNLSCKIECAPEGFKIHPDHKPTYMHESKELAERELLRLQRNFSGEFVLFEAVATAVKITPFVIATPSYYRLDPIRMHLESL